MTSPQLSFVIVSFNTREMTLRCLRNLSDASQGLDAEIFVVDNGSHDGSAQAIESEFPRVKLICNAANRGFGAANNQAMKLATGEFILLLNSDAFPRPQAISRLLDCTRQEARAAVFGPRLLNEDGTLQPSCYRFPSPLKSIWENTLLSAALPNHPIFGDYRAWPHDQKRVVDFLIGACWLVRRAAIEEVGLFDEDFFLYSEETDWAKRFAKYGWKTFFVPESEVVHLGGASGGAQSERVFSEFQRGGERFIRKHFGASGLFIHRLSTVFGACLRIVLFGVAILVRPSSRRHYRALIIQWKRILRWTLGQRGPGLQEI